MIKKLDQIVETKRGQLVDIRRHFHRNPELSGCEYNTTNYLAGLLNSEGMSFQLGPGGRGLIVDLGDREASKRIAIRADIDAIPVQDSKQSEYRSQTDNVMHACGHDAHAAMLFGAVVALKQWFDEDAPRGGAVRFLFQPEEETATGAQAFIQHGVLDGVDAIVASHVDPSRRVGNVGIRSGIITAHCDEVNVAVAGSGGHAARPHETIDPIAAAVQFMSAIYSSINRSVDLQLPVVLTFGQIVGGHQANVIPNSVDLKGTLRTNDPRAREKAVTTIIRIAEGVAASTSAEISVDFGLRVPSVVGDERVTELVRRTCQAELGPNRVEEIDRPSMGGEDFAFYTQSVPAAFIRVGCAGAAKGNVPLHNSWFDIDEAVLPVGAKILASTAINFLCP